VGRWFDDNIFRVVGNGNGTFFWMDNWFGGALLGVRFSRMFELAENRWALVAEMSQLEWKEGGDAWRWRRRLFAWEEENVREGISLLRNIVLPINVLNKWRSQLDPIKGYSVSAEEPIDRGLIDNIWHKRVPLKVSLFSWRLIHNKLPTWDNLMRMRVLQEGDSVCVGGCVSTKKVVHLVLGCNLFGGLWYLIRWWLGISTVDSMVLREHFLQSG